MLFFLSRSVFRKAPLAFLCAVVLLARCAASAESMVGKTIQDFFEATHAYPVAVTDGPAGERTFVYDVDAGAGLFLAVVTLQDRGRWRIVRMERRHPW